MVQIRIIFHPLLIKGNLAIAGAIFVEIFSPIESYTSKVVKQQP